MGLFPQRVFRRSSAKRLAIGVGTCVLLAAASAAHATVVTWNGASVVPSANWSDAGNWVGGVAPVAGDSLVFDGSVQASNTNDFAAGTNFAGITVAATAASTTLGGNSINLAGNLNQNRATTSTFNMPFVLQQSIDIAVPQSGATLTLGGAVSGTGFGVTKTGPGLAIYNVAATYTGGTTINGGTLRTGVSGNTNAILGTAGITIANGATLDLRSTSATTVNSDLTLGAGGGTIGYRGNGFFSPATLTGVGALNLTGDAANIVITPTDFKNWSGQVNGLNSGGLTIRQATAFVNSSMVNISLDLANTVSLTKQNGTNGTTTVVDIGTLSGAAGSSVGGSAAGSGYFTYSIGSRNENSTFSGNLVDGSTRTALRKVGTGAMILAGAANTLSGPSAVNDGKLTVNGALTAAALTLSVNSTGVLGGTGSIAGTVNVVDGTLAPGASAGTLTVGGLSIASTGKLSFELNGADTTVGGGINDLVSVTVLNGLTLDGTLAVTETVAGSFLTALPGQSWRLINYTGTLTDNGLAIGTTPTLASLDYFFTIDASTAGQINLLLNTVAAVPEASAVMFGALAVTMTGAGAVVRRRRARVQA